MIPGSIFFDSDFHFHDGDSAEKLFIILGSVDGTTVVAKTTSQPYGKGITYGCQSADRFHNFYLPQNSCYLSKSTWICLNEFYELKDVAMLQKHFSGAIRHLCDVTAEIARAIQDCALQSEDISSLQEQIITKNLVTIPEQKAD